jgi:UDP-3-O-[3-hydroxymyristoyl] glucosamine N-acyltransferase LpxD
VRALAEDQPGAAKRELQELAERFNNRLDTMRGELEETQRRLHALEYAAVSGRTGMQSRESYRLTLGGELEIVRVIGIEKAGRGELTFISNRKYFHYLKKTRASAVILSPEVPPVKTASLRTPNPYLAFACAIEFFYQPPAPEPGIHPSAVIHPSAKIAPHVNIGAHVVLQEGVELGEGVTIYPNCTLYPYAKIGDGSVLHSNSVVREYVRIGRRGVIQNGAVVGAMASGLLPLETALTTKSSSRGLSFWRMMLK